MKALYRKYRPTSLSNVVGQEQVTAVLKSSLENNKISHAYLFIGPRGTGKTSVARIFAHEVNGFKYELEDNYVDIIEIDGASNRGIDDIRELREKSAIAPTSGKYKIYIIDEVHMLTKEAFNALLKTLEEPPEHVIFIMATTEANKVPITITSRAQLFKFNLADHNTMLKHLSNIAKQEKIPIDNDALGVIVKRGGGSFRDSISLLDQISNLSNQKITKQLVINAMGLPDDDNIKELLVKYQSKDTDAVTETLKNLLITGIKPETITEELISQIIETPNLELIPLLDRLSKVKSPFAEARLLVALLSQEQTPKNTELPIATTMPKPATPKTLNEKKITKEVNTSPTPTESFNWQNLLNKVKAQNDVIYMQLKKAKHSLNDNTLEIYPAQKIGETILSSPNNLAIIKKQLNNIQVIIHKHDDPIDNQPKDEIISKISDIMGGEVKNDGGETPFN